MAFIINVEIDDLDIKQLVDAYNLNSDEEITVADVVARKDDVIASLREFMFDGFITLLESENEEVYDFFADIFDPLDMATYNQDDDIEDESTPVIAARMH